MLNISICRIARIKSTHVRSYCIITTCVRMAFTRLLQHSSIKISTHKDFIFLAWCRRQTEWHAWKFMKTIVRGGSSFDEIGRGSQNDDILLGGSRPCSDKFSDSVGSQKRNFQHFEDVSHHILKKYFDPNEIILTFSVSPHEIAKLNMADVPQEPLFVSWHQTLTLSQRQFCFSLYILEGSDLKTICI